MKIGLVLEGGGMRGIYTVGVLDCLMEENFRADYVIGVSAGACNGASYVSWQKGRAYRTNTEYITDNRYLGLKNYLTTKSLFGMDFLFDEIPNKLIPFDYDTFYNSPCEFMIGVTDVMTGLDRYFDKSLVEPKNILLRASSSLPVFAPMVEYKGKKYLDGGVANSIPVMQALADGCDKIIVVLTRERGYVKKAEKFRSIYKRMYRKYPKLVEALDNRHEKYNETLSVIEALEQNGKALVIAPDSPLPIGRFEKNPDQLKKVWKMGFDQTKKLIKKIHKFSNEAQSEVTL